MIYNISTIIALGIFLSVNRPLISGSSISVTNSTVNIQYLSESGLSGKNNFIDTIKTISHSTLIRLRQELSLSKTKGDEKREAELYNKIGDLYSRFSFNDSAIVYFKKALETGERLDHKDYSPGIRQKIANKYWDIGEYYLALETALNLKEYYEKENTLEDREYLVNLLGIIYLRLKDYNIANEYFQHAIKISERKKNYGLIGVIYSNIGDLYFEQKKYPEAIENLEKGVGLEKENKLFINAGRSYESIARVYLALENPQKAEEQLYNAKKYNQIASDTLGLARTYFTYGKLFNYQKKYNQAIESLNKAEIFALKEGSKDYYMKICEQFSIVYQNINDFKKALYYQNKYDSEYEKIFNLPEYHEIKKLENDLRLAKQNNEINIYKFQKQRAQLLLLISGFFITFIIGLFFWVLYNRTNKSKKSLLALNIELKSAKEKAEESDRLKTAFLHNISHEIRTPMNAIIGFSALLNDPLLTSENRKDFTNVIEQSSNQLLSIITDLIDIATIEAGQEKIQEKDININEFCKQIHNQFLLKAREKGITFENRAVLPESESIVRTDETKLFQILSNIVGNALKFTTRGSVSFGYKLKDKNIEFYIADTGIGIPKEMHEDIFNRFLQVENAFSRQYGGTGLGLSISKAYVELLGGKIWLTSELNKGSVFYFTIPYKKVASINSLTKPTILEKVTKFERPVTVLVAEDEELNFKLIEEFLRSINFTIIHARNGHEAVEICKSGKKIDLVLMDLKMPVMNGFEATKQIKELMPDLPIIAQTAYSTEADKERTFACGCSDFISKPFNKEVLLSRIKKQLVID